MKNTIPQHTLAPSITKTASKQTYYTIRFLVDRERVADAYRAYAYFRWVDDTLMNSRSDNAGPSHGCRAILTEAALALWRAVPGGDGTSRLSRAPNIPA